MVEQQSSIPIGGWAPLRGGRTVEDLAAELRFNMTRHQSMRMRLVFGDDGEPRQSIAAAGEITLEVYDAGEADPAEVAEKVKRHYVDTPFDYTRDWPTRMAVIRSGQIATHVVTIVCHLATDGEGAMAMLADLANLDRETGEAKTPVTAMQPLELARWQRSPAGQQRNAKSLRYWEEQLRAVPLYRYRESTDRRQPRHWEGQLTSPAVHIAAHALAERFGVSSSQVLLAAYAVMLARLRGVDPIVIRPIVNNRFWPGLADIVSPINEAGLCVIPVGDAPFPEVVQHTRRTVMRAFKAAYYHPQDLIDLVAAIGKDRGEEFDLDCFFNDRRFINDPRLARGSEVASVPTTARLRDARQRSDFRWTLKQDKPFGRLFLHVEDSSEVPDAVTLIVRADTHNLAPADMRACVQGMESILVDAALE
jgi:hypothetical protein